MRVEAGTTGLRLVLRETGLLRIEPSGDRLALDLIAVPAGGNYADRERVQFSRAEVEESEDSEESWEEERPEQYEMSLPYGAYDLWRHLGAGDEPRPIVRGIVVPAGGVSDDERLFPLRHDESAGD